MTSPASPRAARVIVCGLTRCGASLAMQMLSVAGVETLGAWPRFERPIAMRFAAHFERGDLVGKAVKLLDPQCQPKLPSRSAEAAVWLDRHPLEQARSIVKFGTAMTGIPEFDPRDLLGALRLDRQAALDQVARAVGDRPFLQLRFEDLICEPLRIAGRLCNLLGIEARKHSSAMAHCVVRRSPACLPGLLEREVLEGRRCR